jgi:glutamine amidotransferase
MTGIIDYGVGNLFSLRSSLAYIGETCTVSADEEQLHRADRIILPGVGAFGDAAEKLREQGLDRFVRREAEAGKPLLGICLGMQLLFESSEEFGDHKGLGLLQGKVVAMEGRLPEQLKIPHIGWNGLIRKRDHALISGIPDGSCVYFVHSFYASGCDDSLVAVTEYGQELTAIVANDKVMGCQFHPEKSGPTGLQILRNFCKME